MVLRLGRNLSGDRELDDFMLESLSVGFSEGRHRGRGSLRIFSREPTGVRMFAGVASPSEGPSKQRPRFGELFLAPKTVTSSEMCK